MRKLPKVLFLFGAWVLGVFLFSASLGYSADSGEDSFKLIVSGSLQFIAKDTFLPGKDLLFLQLAAQDENKNKDNPDNVKLKLSAASSLDAEEITLVETGNDTGVFQNAQGIRILPGNAMIGDSILQVFPTRDIIKIVYLQDDQQRAAVTLKSANVVDRFSIIANPIQIAGKPFRAEIIACDNRGNTSGAYRGKVSLSAEPVFPKKAKSKLSPDNVSSFAMGKNRIFATYSDAGRIKIVAKDKDNNIIGKSDEINFLPAKFKLKVSTPQISGKSFSMEINALSFNNEAVLDYEGSVFIKSVNSGAVIKKNLRFIHGIARTDIIMNSYGEEKFIVCDTDYPDICGISESIFFRPYRFKVTVDSPPINRKKFYFDEVFKGKISALDYKGNHISYGGLLRFRPIKDMDMPKNYYFDKDSPSGTEFFMSGITDVPFRLEVCDTMFPELKGESGIIALMPAKVKTQLIEQKSNAAALEIKIVDDKGEVVKEDSSTMLTVYLAESVPDRSAFLAGPKKINVKNGMAKIAIVDAQREIVSATVNSEQYYLGIEPFDIDFK